MGQKANGNTVYLGGFVFVVVVFVFIFGAAYLSGQPEYLSWKHAALDKFAGFLEQFRSKGPMNVVFIVADDLGWNDVGFRNNELLTPNLNRLAREGVILNQSYVHSTCTPSRAAILTGYYPHRMGLQHRTIAWNQAKFIPLNFPTLAEELKSRGYVTHAVGKWHLGHCNWKYTPKNRGFDSHFGYFLASGDYYKHDYRGTHDLWNGFTPDYNYQEVYSTDLFAQKAVTLIRNHAATRKEPLFMYLAFQAIHGPLNQPPPKYKSPYKEKTRKPRRVVNDMIYSLDTAIGTVADALEETGMMKNTLLIFTSDNGGALDSWADNSPLRGGKFTQWEGGTKAVTFINGPMVWNPGRIFNGLFHAVDWLPTILAGVESRMSRKNSSMSRTDGLNQWLSLVEDIPSKPRTDIVYVLDEVDGTYAYRYGQYKLILGSPVCLQYQKQMSASNGPNPNCWYDTIHPRKKTTSKCEYSLGDAMLFDVVADPEERFDLASERPDIVAALKRRIERLKQGAVPNQSNAAVDISHNIKEGVLNPGWC